MTSRRTVIPTVISFTVLLVHPAAAQNAAAPEPKDVQASWDNLLHDAIPKAAPDPVLKRPADLAGKGAADDFLNHFYFESRSEYWHSGTDFTGLATSGGVVNAPFTNIFNPNGYPYQDAFQPTANRFSTFLDWGTHGWLSDRLDTHFAAQYRTDLTHVNLASPSANILETYNSDRQIELLTGSLTVHGKPTDGWFAGSTLELGRQHVYGAELADVDGASLNISRRQFSFDIFGGRRFSYYSDPEQRAIGGAGLTWRIDPFTSLSYSALVYIHGSQRVNFRRRLTPNLNLVSYFRAYGGAPVDLGADVFYQLRNGRTSLRVGFFDKLSNKDYTYDYTEGARDRDPYNTLTRLYFGQIAKYVQFIGDIRHSFTPWLTVGGSLWARHLIDHIDEGPFNTSFRDYRANAQIIPLRKVQTSFEYHRRDTDRVLPDPTVPFDDITAAGETKVTDLTGDIRRSFFEGGRVTLNGGVYYRRFSIQDRFLTVTGAHQSGWLAGITVKADQHTRAFVDYALDNDFFIFRPDLQRSRILRVGLAWKY
jgi:hypothetical protein